MSLENDSKHSAKLENDDEWKAKLSPESYYVLRQKGTEAPFSGKYNHHSEEGLYYCIGCHHLLFK